MELSKYNAKRIINLPIYGAGADIKKGAIVKRGTDPATDNGMLIKGSGFSAMPDIVGFLEELHDYSVTGDTLIDGTSFVTHGVKLAFSGPIFTMEFSLDSADLVTCTQAVNTPTMTVSSIEDNIDGSFVYVAAGTGRGQLQYLTASSGTNMTLKAAFSTNLDTTSKFVKILRRFHDLVGFNSDGTKLASQAGAGAVKALILDIRMQKDERFYQLDPTKDAGRVGLHNARGLKFVADVILRDTAAYTVD